MTQVRLFSTLYVVDTSFFFVCGTGSSHSLGNGDEMAAIYLFWLCVFVSIVIWAINYRAYYILMSRISTNGALTSSLDVIIEGLGVCDRSRGDSCKCNAPSASRRTDGRGGTSIHLFIHAASFHLVWGTRIRLGPSVVAYDVQHM